MAIIGALAAAIIAYLKTASIGSIAGLFVIVFIGVPIAFRAGGELFTSLSEQIPLNVKLKGVKNPKLSTVLRDDGFWENQYFTYIRVRNKEHAEISDCHAVIEMRCFQHQALDLLYGNGEKLLKWQDTQTTSCNTTLSPFSGEKILLVYEFGFQVKDNHNPDDVTVERKITNNHFCICGENRKLITHITDNKWRYVLSISMNGKLNQKDIKPKRMFYYLDLNFNLNQYTHPKIELIETNSLVVCIEELAIKLKYRIRMMSKKEKDQNQEVDDINMKFMRRIKEEKLPRKRGKK